MLKIYKYKTSILGRTFDKYNHVDCYNYMDIHDILKLYKHGYSKVTDYCNFEIRHKRMSREYAIRLVSKYENHLLRYKDLFCEWLNILPESLQFVLNQHKSNIHWNKIDINEWKPNLLSGRLLKENKTDKYRLNYSNSYYQTNKSISLNNKRKYIIFGKGLY